MARVFQDKYHRYDCFEKNARPRPAKVSKPKTWDMHIASLAGSEAERAELLARVFQDKFHQRDCTEKLVPKTSQTVSKRWAKGHAGHGWEKVLCWIGFHFARRSVRRCLFVGKRYSEGSDDRVGAPEQWGELLWRERDGSARRAWAGRVMRVFRNNFNQCDCLCGPSVQM